MTAPLAADESFAQETLVQSPHYVRAVTGLGDHQDVIAREDIYAANGMKLVAKGTRIRSELYEKLTQHRLRQPIDRNLTAVPLASARQLAADISALQARDATMQSLAEHSGDPLALKQELWQLELPDSIALRISVMRDQREPMYWHSLRAAQISHYLSLRLNLSRRDGSSLLMAAICHDVGELYTDPTILAPSHAVTPGERRFIYVHPITGYLALREMREWHDAATAVLYHHERLDGSGYPYGLQAEQLGALSRILALAEVSATLLSKFTAQRLGTVLQLSQRKFDPRAVDALVDAVHRMRSDVGPPATSHDLESYLGHLAKLLARWHHWQQTLPPAVFGPAGPLNFLHERMANLRSVVLQMGFDPETPNLLLNTLDDPAAEAELIALMDEVNWQVQDLAHEIERRMEALSNALDMMQWAAVEDWLGQLHATHEIAQLAANGGDTVAQAHRPAA